MNEQWDGMDGLEKIQRNLKQIEFEKHISLNRAHLFSVL